MTVVRVIGAGFSGLTAAYYLQQAGYTVEVCESAVRCGGMLQSHKLPGLGLVETAANAALNSARLEALAQTIGIEFLPVLPSARNRYIWRGRPRRWPLSIAESLGMGLRAGASWMRGRALFTPPQEITSVESWARQKFGEAALAFLIEPGLGGVYGLPAKDLTANLVLGSLMAARQEARMERPGRRFRGSTAPRGGMGELVSKLEAWLKNAGVSFRRGQVVSGEDILAWSQENPVVVATGIEAVPDLIGSVHDTAAIELRLLERVSLVSVTIVFPKNSQCPVGFGCLFPVQAGFTAKGVLWNSAIFSDRSEQHSETWIFARKTLPGETGAEGILGASDEELLKLILQERMRAFALADTPIGSRVTRWPRALPAYGPGLAHWLGSPRLEQLAERGVFLHGNYLGRLGLSGILEGSAQLPNRISAHSLLVDKGKKL